MKFYTWVKFYTLYLLLVSCKISSIPKGLSETNSLLPRGRDKVRVRSILPSAHLWDFIGYIVVAFFLGKGLIEVLKILQRLMISETIYIMVCI